MRWVQLTLILLLSMLGSTGALGGEFEKVLVPLRPGAATPGAGGSSWKVEFSILNHAGIGVGIGGIIRCASLCPPDLSPIPSGTAFSPTFLGNSPTVPGHFLYIEAASAGEVEMSLRVRDLSRQAETWGVSVPTVRESLTYPGRTSELFDVPLAVGFRHTLRVYSFDPKAGSVVRLNFYSFDASKDGGDGSFDVPDRLIASRILPLFMETSGGGTSWYPGYAVLNGFAEIPELAGHTNVRVEVVPESLDRIWAMLSITHDTTQHVTVISPN